MQPRERIRIQRLRGIPAVWLCACLLLTLAAAPAAAGQRTVFAGGNHILVIDEATMNVLGQIPVQKHIHQLVVDQARERVYAAHSGGVEIFDARSYSSLGFFHEEPARRLELSADGNTLYALTHPILVNADGQKHAGEFAIQIIDLQQNKVSGSVNLGYDIFDAVVDPVSGKVFSMKRFDRSLSVHSLAGGQRLGTVNITPDLDPLKINLLHFISRSPDGQHLYVPQHGASACVFDVDTLSGASRAIDLGSEFFIRDSQVSPDGRSLFLLSADQLIVVNTVGRNVAATRPLDEVYLGLDLSADGTRLYLSNPLHGDGSAGNLLVLDARSLKQSGMVETPGLSLFTAAAFERD
jgi:DNA-binding beta-propeller fold protein YncE